jgi:hypothetical protein
MAKKSGRHGFRGVPPPPNFSLEALPADTQLKETEVAACCRVAISTVAGWRQDPNHPLEWDYLPGGWPRTTAGRLREYMASGVRRRRADLSRQREADTATT